MTRSSIRKALPCDIPEIYTLLRDAAKTSSVIPRSRAALYDTVRDFFVYEEDGKVLGCCALHVTWGDLAEIKSLSVHPDTQGKGLGRHLIEACLAEAREMQLPRVFALTAAVAFFERLGFTRIDKETLPHKVWGDCINCPSYPDCDEIAMEMRLVA